MVIGRAARGVRPLCQFLETPALGVPDPFDRFGAQRQPQRHPGAVRQRHDQLGRLHRVPLLDAIGTGQVCPDRRQIRELTLSLAATEYKIATYGGHTGDDG